MASRRPVSPDDPVGADEVLLRSLKETRWNGEFPDWDIFMPRAPMENHPGDVNGVSVSRRLFTNWRTFLREGYVAAKFAARSAHDLGLSVEPDKTDENPGHARIPELRWRVDLDRTPERKAWLKRVKELSAALANKCHELDAPDELLEAE